MTCTPGAPLQIIAEAHEIDGGGYQAEAARFPGCVTQAETIEALKESGGTERRQGRSGFVPPAHMTIVNSKTAVRAQVVGGWP